MPTTGTKSSTADTYLWVGATGGSWSSATNWDDTAAGTNPAPYVPGTLTPVTINAPSSTSFEAINGGGTAASLRLTGAVALNGQYAVGDLVLDTVPGPFSYQNTSINTGLSLGAGSTISAAAVTANSASIAVAGAGAGLTASCTVTLGGLTNGGRSTVRTSGDLAVSAGAFLAAGAMTVISGAFSVSGAGSKAALGGALALGAPGAPGGSSLNYALSAGGLSVDAGASLAVGGPVSLLYGSSASVTGSGSRLTSSGQLTLSNTGAGAGAPAPTLTVSSGGFVQAAGLDAAGLVPGQSASQGVIAVDAASTLEVGSAGNAAAGTITVDAGSTASMAGAFTLYGDVVDNGVLSETGGTLTVNGNLSGSGQLQIGQGATLALNGTVAATDVIAFIGSGATLSVGNASTTPYGIGPTLTGFQAGDSIVLAAPVSTATYAAGPGGGPGLLTLGTSGAAAETFSLSGDFTGKSFSVTPTASGGASISLVNQAPVPAGGKSSTADGYLWVGSTGGSWDSAGNWSDATTGTNPALYVPGALTPVTITGPTGSTFEVISGGGGATSLGVTGYVNLNGAYTVGGAFNVGSLATTNSLPPTGSLVLAAGSTVTAGSVNVLYGTLSLAGASGVASTGAITVGGNTLNLAAGARLSTSDALSVSSGTLNDKGGAVSVGGALTIGTPLPSSLHEIYQYLSYQSSQSSRGYVAVSSGGTLAIGGDITNSNGSIGVDGAGSKLTTGGTLTATTGKVGVGTGGSIQLSGAILGAASLVAFEYTFNTTGLITYSTAGLSVDATSTIEIGAAGGAAAGAITVDTGRTITANSNANLSGALVNNGTVTITGGTLTQNGNISGNGTMQIGKDATLLLNGSVAATDQIAFLDTGATLAIGSSSYSYAGALPIGATSYSEDATLTGFQVGDSITLGTPVSTATYAAGSGGSPGTLTLSNGAATVETLHLAGDFTGKIFFISPKTNGGASISLIDGPVGTPVLSSPTVTVAENAASTALGIAAPTDPNYAAGQLSITAATLPTDGAVTLADGTTAVTTGQTLTGVQLTSLRFKPTPGLFNTSSTFTYTVSDPANNTATGTATLAIGPALGNPVLSSPTFTVAENAATTLSIAAPTDPNYATGQLAVTATSLPGNGTLTLADGTPLAAGQALTSAQLTGLRFKPTPGLFNANSAFGYTVSDPAGNASTGTATLAIGPALGNPVLSSSTLTVAGNAASTALGLAAPTDPNYAAKQLSITAASLPGDGTLTLADGTAVTAGQALTSDQLTGLRFKPTPGLFNASSAFTYTVSDPANNAATLAIGPAPTPKAEFDAAYYLRNNPDVAAAGVDPLKHFNQYGWKEGRNPDALFNTQYYLNQNPDVAAAKVNPLTHYETNGWKEGRDPSVNFSTAAYLKANPDVANAHIDPLQHYIDYGSREGRMSFAAQPHGVGAQDLLVDNAYYFSKYSDVSVSGVNPFTDYDTAGWRQGRNPDALFDTNYYLQHNPDVKAAAIDPLLHYEQYGWKEGRDPSAQFSTSKYLAANADVKAAGLDPLVHYEQHGIQEGARHLPRVARGPGAGGDAAGALRGFGFLRGSPRLKADVSSSQHGIPAPCRELQVARVSQGLKLLPDFRFYVFVAGEAVT